MKKRFLIMAGGTGGHVFPGLAIAKALIEQGHSVDWMGTEAGIESELVPKANIPIHYIQIKGVRGKGVAGLLVAPFKIIAAIMQSVVVLRKVKPHCVVGFGGFVSGPGAVAAKILALPLVIHEQNAIPGTTNKILSRLANKVMIAFPGAFSASEKVLVVGNPVRSDIHRSSAVENHEPLHVLVVGGSLGAQAINEIMPKLLDSLPYKIQLLHQTGKKHIDQVRENYGNKITDAIRVVPFIDDMAQAFAWADLVICRSGAMTVSEVAVAGLPAIFIPFPFAIDDHQTANARWMADAGAAYLLPQSAMTVDSLRIIMDELHNDRHKLLEMKNKSAALGVSDSTQRVVEICVELAK